MKGSLPAVAVGLLCLLGVSANEQLIDEKNANRQRCSGMYSRKAWGGAVDPFILTSFEKQVPAGDEDPVVSLVIFEWKDEKFVGKYSDPAASSKELICDDENIRQKLCNETSIGAFIIDPAAAKKSLSPIVSRAIHLKDPPVIHYPVKQTGYYCIGTYRYTADKYNAVVEFRNAYGELPAAQIAKLPFYGGLTIVYAVVGAFWAFLYVQHRRDILPVQNYITAILVFLILEMLMTWGFYDYQNRHGSTVLAKVLMVAVAILNAGRASFSFFLLLIVCLGYGVVKLSLGRSMLYIRALAVANFIFGVIYAIASLSITPDSVGPLILFIILPQAATLTAFYVWTLNALQATRRDLKQRKQAVKERMYLKLWWAIIGSILVIFGFFFVNSFTFAGRNDHDFVPDHWQTRWFILDGWLNLVYLVDLAYIAYLWRPTANNRRFAMSDELAQDDDGFEVTSFGGSLDEEGRGDESSPAPPPAPPPQAAAGPASAPQPARSTAAKAKAPPATKSLAHDARGASLDGETIFAVGEDGDRWSDDDDDDAEELHDDGKTGAGVGNRAGHRAGNKNADDDDDERTRLTTAVPPDARAGVVKDQDKDL
ncbi:MAG: hypothetical protein M1826_005568 [Phylliscum demangeonii]|nr:MAG: hypothetical protein M1826_005568 [Phylliscum demangeonii]